MSARHFSAEKSVAFYQPFFGRDMVAEVGVNTHFRTN